MATRKTSSEEIEKKEMTEEEPAKKAAEDQDPWEQEVEMLVPRKPAGDDQQYYVCVNDRRFSIPANGKMQKLPQPIAEVLRSSLEDELAAEEFAEKMPHNG